MRKLVIPCLVLLFSPTLLVAQVNNDDPIISNDSILKITPGEKNIDGVVPGECKTVLFRIRNIGAKQITISALYLNDADGTDDFHLVDPRQVPFELDSTEFFIVRVDFCPDVAGRSETVLQMEYGIGKVLRIQLKGNTTTIFDMDWCEDFNDKQTDDLIQNGWAYTKFGGYHLDYPAYVSTLLCFSSKWGSLLDSNALFLGNIFPSSEIITPGIRVSGIDPAISWLEMLKPGYYNILHPGTIKHYISTDYDTWELIDTYYFSDNPEYILGKDFSKRYYSLEDYTGKTIWWKIEIILGPYNEDCGTCTGATPICGFEHWIIDDICVQQRPEIPMLKIGPEEVDFKGVLLGNSVSQIIKLTNEGASIAKIKSIVLESDKNDWYLTDTNNYPVEIHDGDYAFTYNGKDTLEVSITFAPESIGVSNAKLLINWGLYEDKVDEVTLTGSGISCKSAVEAHIGENWAESQDSWFNYTADKYQVVNINSCHPNQQFEYPYSMLEEYAYDTWVWVFADCDSSISTDYTASNPNLIAQNDDLYWDDCGYSWLSSGVQFAMDEGETVMIYWPWVWRSPHDDEGFYFNIDPYYPIDGDVCETAISLTLPVVNHFGTTIGYEDDYDESPCSPFSNYMDGNDKVYSITLENEGFLTGSIIGAYGSIHVLVQCPVEELVKRHCMAFASGPTGGKFEKFLDPGTYYVIISSWAPPQTVDYLLNMSFFGGLSVENDKLTSSIEIYPNPSSGNINIIGLSEPSEVKVYSIQGKLLKSINQVEYTLDITNLKPGLYFLDISVGNKTIVKKTMVKR